MSELLQPQHLHRGLDGLGLRVFTNEVGANMVLFGESGESPRHEVLVAAENDGRVLRLQFEFGVPVNEVPFAAMVCFTNTWNREKRWPTAAAALNKDGRTTVTADVSVPAPLGMSIEQLQETLRLLLGCGRSFGIKLADFVNTRPWSLDDEDLARLLESDA